MDVCDSIRLCLCLLADSIFIARPWPKNLSNLTVLLIQIERNFLCTFIERLLSLIDPFEYHSSLIMFFLLAQSLVQVEIGHAIVARVLLSFLINDKIGSIA